VTGTLENWGVVDVALCRELVGYLGRTIELVGAKNVLMEHPRCRARGDRACFFQARWGERRAIVGVPSSSPDAVMPRARSGPLQVGGSNMPPGGKVDSG